MSWEIQANWEGGKEGLIGCFSELDSFAAPFF